MDARKAKGRLRAIKVAHTAIWLFFVVCILSLPLAGERGDFRLAALLSVLVLGECLTLVMFGGRCPMTLVAARYGHEQNANFDIYLPEWLARYNKAIFGTLYVLGELFVLGHWLGRF